MQLFLWPNLRKKTLICYYLWFSTALIYYGLTLNSNTLGTELFTTFSIGKVTRHVAIVTSLGLNYSNYTRLFSHHSDTDDSWRGIAPLKIFSEHLQKYLIHCRGIVSINRACCSCWSSPRSRW